MVVPLDISTMFEAGVVTSCASQIHPLEAAGRVIVPVEAAQPVPTLIVKAHVPLFAATDGLVQKPETVGAVVLPIKFVAVREVNFPVEAVVAPTDMLLIVPAVAGLMVTVPVPVGERTSLAFAGDNVTVLEAVSVVNAPVFGVVAPTVPFKGPAKAVLAVIVVPVIAAGVVPPIAPGAANVAPFREEALRFATFVVEVIENGAVPVAKVLVIWPLKLPVVNAPVFGVVAPTVPFKGPAKAVLAVIVVPVIAAGVVPPNAPGDAIVAPFNEEALRFATFVVEATENGAVPVANELVIWPVKFPVVNAPVERVVLPIAALSIVPPVNVPPVIVFPVKVKALGSE